jgi:predicted O-linked N-acetylglucosamine transferase (SPINDLY family)
VERSQIERHFNSGKFSQALEGLESYEISQWRDTTRLRCFRAIGIDKQTIEWASELHIRLNTNSSPYKLNTSERNNQLRYIALVYAELGEARKACAILQSLCKGSPDVPALHREYAFALTNDSQLDAAEKHLIKALELQPSNANSHAQLGGIYCRTGRVDAGYSSYSKAATLEPDNPIYIQRLVYWSNYTERTTQQSNYQLSRLWSNKVHPANQAGTNTSRTVNPDRQLKIGFVSSDFCAHAVSFFIVPLLEGIDRSQFNITAYSDTKKVDGVTESIKRLCDVWRDTSRSKDPQLAAQISADQIDILIDLNGHSAGNRLNVFAKNVVPLQVSWLGYPSTTGLRSIGFRITDRIADPAGLHDQFFSESLLRLPNGLLCFKPLATAPDIAPTDNGGIIRFGSFNNLAKISSLTLDAWAATLQAVPRSTLYLKRHLLTNKRPTNFFIQEFADRGISKDRLIFKTSNAKIETHLAEYNNIDIALDTSPYNGVTTTLEALWMGVPVISLMGQTHASRVSASILHRLNLGGLATKTVVEFSERAKELSAMEDKLTQLRSDLRDQMRKSTLMNNTQFSREFGNTLRSQWRDWCHQHNTEEQHKETLNIGATK